MASETTTRLQPFHNNNNNNKNKKPSKLSPPSGFGQLLSSTSSNVDLGLTSVTSPVSSVSSGNYAQSFASDGFEDSWTSDMETESTLASSETCSESGYSDKCSASSGSGWGSGGQRSSRVVPLLGPEVVGDDLNGNLTLNGKQIDLTSERYSVLTYEQVVRLDEVMEEVIINQRGLY